MGIFDIFKSRNSLKRKVIKIEEEIKEIVSRNCSEKFSVLHYGEYNINPKYLVFWICVQTDEMKMKLENNNELNAELREILVKVEYPSLAINDVQIGFESQETVDRESHGDWYLHFK
jgi:hypothetical protein